MEQLNRNSVIAIYNSGIWRTWTAKETVMFHLFQDLMCVDIEHIHTCFSEFFGRSFCTNELAKKEALIKEFLGEDEPPTFDTILNLIKRNGFNIEMFM